MEPHRWFTVRLAFFSIFVLSIIECLPLRAATLAHRRASSAMQTEPHRWFTVKLAANDERAHLHIMHILTCRHHLFLSLSLSLSFYLFLSLSLFLSFSLSFSLSLSFFLAEASSVLIGLVHTEVKHTPLVPNTNTASSSGGGGGGGGGSGSGGGSGMLSSGVGGGVGSVVGVLIDPRLVSNGTSMSLCPLSKTMCVTPSTASSGGGTAVYFR
jgi:uncharacterized membrane protein YgcG